MPKPRIEELLAQEKVECKDLKSCYQISSIASKEPGTQGEYISTHIHNWQDGLFLPHLPVHQSQFIDVETRGLAASSQIWLIGTAYLQDNELHILQLLARDPLEEKGMLENFAFLSEKSPYWISFNGQTFDRHRLLRRAQAHCITPAKPKEHVDVYHYLRARHKKSGLQSLTLLEMERIKFPKLKRSNHIEGKNIPIVYANYIRGGDATPLLGAIHHNAYDLVTLAALYVETLASHTQRSMPEAHQ